MRDLFQQDCRLDFVCVQCEKQLPMHNDSRKRFCSKKCNNIYHGRLRWKFERLLRNVAKEHGIDRNKVTEDDLKIINRELWKFGQAHHRINEEIEKLSKFDNQQQK
jgi:endogenous inhibitor of DNA gyrase (YacG/DUF329 family)